MHLTSTSRDFASGATSDWYFPAVQCAPPFFYLSCFPFLPPFFPVVLSSSDPATRSTRSHDARLSRMFRALGGHVVRGARREFSRRRRRSSRRFPKLSLAVALSLLATNSIPRKARVLGGKISISNVYPGEQWARAWDMLVRVRRQMPSLLHSFSKETRRF